MQHIVFDATDPCTQRATKAKMPFQIKCRTRHSTREFHVRALCNATEPSRAMTLEEGGQLPKWQHCLLTSLLEIRSPQIVWTICPKHQRSNTFNFPLSFTCNGQICERTAERRMRIFVRKPILLRAHGTHRSCKNAPRSLSNFALISSFFSPFGH